MTHQDAENNVSNFDDLAVSCEQHEAGHDLDPAHPDDERVEPKWLRDVLDRLQPPERPES
jgi:hypothetical protein